MTPQEIATSLLRLCEIGDLAVQGGIATSEDDEQHLTRMEAVAEALKRLAETPVTSGSVRTPRPVVWDSPEDVSAARSIIDVAEELMEVACGVCHDTKKVMRTNRHGEWVQTAERCPECTSPPVGGSLTPEQAEEVIRQSTQLNRAQAARNFVRSLEENLRREMQVGAANWVVPTFSDPPDAEAPEDIAGSIQVDGVALRPGSALTFRQRNYLRGLAQNGHDRARLLAREILDASEETWVFDGGVVKSVGATITIREYRQLRNVISGDGYSDAQKRKADRFLRALSGSNRRLLGI